MKLAPLPAAPLRLVFLGTPELAATVLRGLLEGPDEICAVFTRPDSKKGRGMELLSPPVKEIAEARGIPIFQPTTWKDGLAVTELREINADLAITAAYGHILPQAALDAPRLGCINVHASLLPRWRGADPIRRSILTGDAETGVTIMQMTLKMDAGACLLQRHLGIDEDDTLASLEEKLAKLGGEALREALALWRAGDLEAIEQDPAFVTFAPMSKKQDGRIEWRDEAAVIERRVRAFTPWPGATASFRGHPLRVWQAGVETAGDLPEAEPGTISSVDKAGVLVATGSGLLRLLELQSSGKKRMSAAAWARGVRLEAGQTFDD